MLEEIERYAARGDSLGFETTLSGRSYSSMIRRLKKSSYEVHFSIYGCRAYLSP